ncbi:glucose-6-phosphate isomerase [Pancytospora epiphaga]|nr:glucose-6-phosphate isomerase [Pancytospora epiphaga]
MNENRQFVAVTSNVAEAEKYGISQIFKMWDFVGGRYSLWSAAGLSIAIYIGFGNYMKLLEGASVADEDFFNWRNNSISAKLAINELFYIDHGYNNKCLVTYDGYLGLLYKYLQQAEMESNGKAGSKQMIIWGGVGTDVQHSFFQLLHQGEQEILTEFLLPIQNLHLASKSCCLKKCNMTCCNEQCESNCDCPENKLGEKGCSSPCGRHCEKESSLRSYSLIEEAKKSIAYHHELLASNCLAQSRSLMVGRASEDKSKDIKGDKPSITLLYSYLSPRVLGAILAIYEHKIFVEGIAFGINSFDQFGVQLGKDIALELFPSIVGEEKSFDSSTNFLIQQLKK